VTRNKNYFPNGNCGIFTFLRHIFGSLSLTLIVLYKVILCYAVRQRRIEYRVASFVWRCQFGVDPICLVGLCRYVSGITSGISLRSAGRGFLSVPFARTNLMQTRAFCVNGPSV